MSDVLLVGGVAYDNVEEVFEKSSAILGSHVSRIPDGETGARNHWVGWQIGHLKQVSDLNPVERTDGSKFPIPWFVPADGVDPSEIDLGTLGYADVARESYEIFKRFKSEGKIAKDVRFQVSLPSSYAGCVSHMHPDFKESALPSFERWAIDTVAAIAEFVPLEELAIQWDVCIEIGYWEADWPHFENIADPNPADQSDVLDHLAVLGDAVPEPAEVGYHLCWGDFGHKHFKEPTDLAMCTAISNGLSERVKRPITWMHMPVPVGRSDDAYFAPLADLKLRPETTLYLGLVHHHGGVEGNKERIATASKYVDGFGIATECGLGRRPQDTMDELLAQHVETAEAIGG